MRELRTNTDIFLIPNGINTGLCVTTNGIVSKQGHAVMGAGIAKQCNDLYHVSDILGNKITAHGNRVYNLGTKINPVNGNKFNLFSFPTKHHWKEDSDINLIAKSAEQLVELCNSLNITKCFLPKVGCGLGKLNYEVTVKPWLSMILDDRFIIVLRE